MPLLGSKAADSPAQDVGVRRFAAFISYSHDDEVVARWLQRKLETYRLPKGLRAGARTGRGKDGDRLGAIFRDREDFAAATSLSDAIREALAHSGALIVLCSPTARASHWVNAEIALFRELHPDAPILAAIVDGEPEEAMPEALIADGREPLAADLRKEGDGRRIGLLKIVAALWDLPLGAVIDRDALRQRKSVIVVTVVVMIAMAIMAAMTAYAIHSRNEAQRQRAEAEGLVEYMLTDLRANLRGVGSLRVMSAVNDRALTYYREQGDLADLPDDSLERRARALQAMGEDEVRRDNLPAAAQRFADAYATTEALLMREPNNPDRIFAHAQSEYWVGDLAMRRGQGDEHERRMRNYAALATRLDAVDPNRVRALREIGYANGNLCSIAVGKVEPVVTDHCAIALDAMRRVYVLRSDEQQAHVDLINRLNWYAEYEFGVGRRQHALATLDEALREARKLVADDPGNRDSRDMLVSVLMNIGEYNAQSDPAAAAAGLAEAQAIVGELSRFDPTNERWRRMADLIANEQRRIAGQH